jgi:hypothetical protein
MDFKPNVLTALVQQHPLNEWHYEKLVTNSSLEIYTTATLKNDAFTYWRRTKTHKDNDNFLVTVGELLHLIWT